MSIRERDRVWVSQAGVERHTRGFEVAMIVLAIVVLALLAQGGPLLG